MTRKNILAQSRRKKAQTLLQANRLEEAKNICVHICEKDRRDVDAWIMLGNINRRLGAFGEAEQCCHQALNIQPNNAAAHHALGAILQCRGNMNDAVAHYRQAISLQPDFANTHYFLGNALRESGRLEEAATSYRKAVQLQPDFLEALGNLGATLTHLGNYQEALACLQQVLHIDPGVVQAHCNLANVLLYLDKPEQALQHARTATHTAPGFLDAHEVLGNVLKHTGDYEEALKSYRTALTIKPDDENISAACASILERRGEFEESYALIRKFTDAGSLHPGILITFSYLSPRLKLRDQAIDLLEKLLTQNGISLHSRIDAHFELGKHYDAMASFDLAFTHYRQANEIYGELNKELTRAKDSIQPFQELYAWREECDIGFWTNLHRSSDMSERPIFVVGMPRSGTTLAEQILASHPLIEGAGELAMINQISKDLPNMLHSDSGYPLCLMEATSENLDTLAARYLDHIADFSADTMRVVDKMPYNFIHTGLISLLFPKAHIIHMVRNPLDTCLSIYFQKFGATLSYACDLEQLGTYYREYRALMTYWNEMLDYPILEVCYEDLVNEPEKMSRRMVEFCGLNWDERCLRFHETKRDINTPSYQQVRQPIYTKSIDRWKNYKQHLGPLENALEM